jgi:hypothetical protein
LNASIPDEKSSGANPKIISYNASVAKIYNATNRIARFWNKINFANVQIILG